QIEPSLRPAVEYSPNAAGEQNARLISPAAVGIFPLQWSEPFGLAMVECMVAGTPVLALRTGSTPELIEPGVTGFLAEDVEDLIEPAGRLHQIDPLRCPEVARERFGPHQTAERCISVYRRGSVDVEPLAAPTAAAIEMLT